jgi:hypothetical protein
MSTEDIPDGKTYIAAVIAAGDRSLRIIYFILILVVLTFTSIKNNYYPDWMSARFKANQDLYSCLRANDIKSDDCVGLRKRADRAHLVEKTGEQSRYKITELAEAIGYSLRGEFGTPDFV